MAVIGCSFIYHNAAAGIFLAYHPAAQGAFFLPSFYLTGLFPRASLSHFSLLNKESTFLFPVVPGRGIRRINRPVSFFIKKISDGPAPHGCRGCMAGGTRHGKGLPGPAGGGCEKSFTVAWWFSVI
ncbi:hypothetical protein [Chimaeribacter arupi]|uniref:hypothetical protein n=1 Tax=Chimaeribacter arupi TaxID=2060066 RepID=UPI0011AF69FB|nr:hypothetical protein [Chimaeribacter arupi]